MIKEVSYAAYIIPVRIKNNKKEVAILEYAPSQYGTIGGRFDEGELKATTALRRELIEELGKSSEFMVDLAEPIKEPYRFKVAEHKIEKRGAYNEVHFFFIAKVPEDTILKFCEKRENPVKLVWVDSEKLVDPDIIGFPDQREYFKKYLMPKIRKIVYYINILVIKN